MVEVEEDELGIPVTASYHVKVPPRHNAVFEVNIHAELQGTQVIMGNKHLLEKHPNMYHHEIPIVTESDSKAFPLMAITNLDQVKTLHLAKGEVVGFARPESPDVTHIATTNELNIEETLDMVPRNWIPQRKWNLKSQALRQPQARHSKCSESSQNSRTQSEVTEIHACDAPKECTTLMFQGLACEYGEDSQKSWIQNSITRDDFRQNTRDCSERH